MSTSERWPVIDTHYHTGVCLINTFDAEHELIPWMDKNGVKTLDEIRGCARHAE